MKYVFLEEIKLFLFSLLLLFLGYFRINQIPFGSFLSLNKTSPPTLEDLLTSFLLALFFILILVYGLRKKPSFKGYLFRAIFFLALFLGNLLFWEAIFYSSLLSLALSLFFIFILRKFNFWFLHNIFLAIALVGFSLSLGVSFNPLILVLFLVILSLYDFFAVYITRHMVVTAKGMIEAKSPLAFIFPIKKPLTTKTTELINLWLQKDKKEFVILGSGDILFPLLFISSVLFWDGVKLAFIVSFFSLAGVLLSLYLFLYQSKNKPMPALPPIALMVLLGYLLGKILISL